jgi:hypothetical protein
MIIQSLPKRTRTVRRTIQKEPEDSRVYEREKRGRKRKEREGEGLESRQVDAIKPFAPSVDAERERKAKDSKEKDREKGEKEKKKSVRTPTRPNSGLVHSNSSVPVSHATPTTPSLKIRLPRLNNISGLHATSASG